MNQAPAPHPNCSQQLPFTAIDRASLASSPNCDKCQETRSSLSADRFSVCGRRVCENLVRGVMFDLRLYSVGDSLLVVSRRSSTGISLQSARKGKRLCPNTSQVRRPPSEIVAVIASTMAQKIGTLISDSSRGLGVCSAASTSASGLADLGLDTCLSLERAQGFSDLKRF